MTERLKEFLPNPYSVDYDVPHDGYGFDLYDERKMIEYGIRLLKECASIIEGRDENGNAKDGQYLLEKFGIDYIDRYT